MFAKIINKYGVDVKQNIAEEKRIIEENYKKELKRLNITNKDLSLNVGNVLMHELRDKVDADYEANVEALEEYKFLDTSELEPKTEKPFTNVPYYVLNGNAIIRKWEVVDNSINFNQDEIESLKRELSEDDYKVVKCMESMILGEEMPYDVKNLIKERNLKRDKIRLLKTLY